jgi:hypothetical protein
MEMADDDPQTVFIDLKKAIYNIETNMEECLFIPNNVMKAMGSQDFNAAFDD